MEYQQTGTHQITPDLTLTDFIWSPNSVYYGIGEPNVIINVTLGDQNVREIEIPVPPAWTEQDICDGLMTLPAFAGSTPIP
jgi:hypothetical protein